MLRSNFYLLRSNSGLIRNQFVWEIYFGAPNYIMWGGGSNLICALGTQLFYVGVPTFDLGVQLLFRGIKLFCLGTSNFICGGAPLFNSFLLRGIQLYFVGRSNFIFIGGGESKLSFSEITLYLVGEIKLHFCGGGGGPTLYFLWGSIIC